MEETNILGAAIRAARDELGISQEGMARELDVSWKTISRYEGNFPPSGPALLRVLRWAERRGLGPLSALLRHEYIRDMDPEVLIKLSSALMQQLPVFIGLANIKARAEHNIQSGIADDRQTLGEVESLEKVLESVFEAIELVLPMGETRRENPDGTVTTGKSMYRSLFPKPPEAE